MNRNIELFNEIHAKVENLEYDDVATLDAIRRRTDMLIRKTFGEDSKYINDLHNTNFHLMIVSSDTPE